MRLLPWILFGLLSSTSGVVANDLPRTAAGLPVALSPTANASASAFGSIAQAILSACSEDAIDQIVDEVGEQANVLGVEMIKALFRLVDHRREALDPMNDALIASKAETLGMIAQARLTSQGQNENAILIGADVRFLYIERVRAWAESGPSCAYETRREYAVGLAKQLLAKDEFWLELLVTE